MKELSNRGLALLNTMRETLTNSNIFNSCAISKMMSESLSGLGSLRPGVLMGMTGNSFLLALLELTGTPPGHLKNKK